MTTKERNRMNKYPDTATFHWYNANPKGKITGVDGHHIVAIVDCKIQDIWNSSNKCIGNYWTKG